MQLFPIQDSQIFKAIPWSVIADHEAQAFINHSQTLTKLAFRCGLSPCEAVAVIENKRYRDRWPGVTEKWQGDAELLLLVCDYFHDRAKP